VTSRSPSTSDLTTDPSNVNILRTLSSGASQDQIRKEMTDRAVDYQKTMVAKEGNEVPRSVLSGLRLYGPVGAFVAATALSVTLFLRGNSASNTYYVSSTGSDSNPCTQSNPCATPNYVVNNKAAAGDTVQVAAGTYDYGSSEVHFTKSGAAGKYINLICATRGACKIQNSVSGNSTVVEIDSNYFIFDGFEVTNTSSGGNNIGIYIRSSFVKATRNKIHHIETDCSTSGGGGIEAYKGSHDLTVDSNLVWDIGWPDGGSPKCSSSTVQTDGLNLETDGANVVATNNVVYHVSGGWGIAVGPGSAGSTMNPATVSNNTVFSNSNGGIVLVNSTDYSTVTNNIVLNNGSVRAQCGINTVYPGNGTDGHILEANNNVYGNAGGDYCAAGTPIQQNNISVNPALGTIFANWQANGSGDYHQKAGSPTINNGTSSTGALTTDFDGNPRPQGAAFDIGAYESPN
jgi:parallel beta-helix repeat protein